MKKVLWFSGWAVLSLMAITSFGKDKKGGKTKKTEEVVILFDGTSLDGWRGYNSTGIPSCWSIDDGAVKISNKTKGEAEETRSDLIYVARKFRNFELTFEWKVSQKANSGVFYYAREIPDKPIYISAPEYQILDNANHPDAKLGTDGNRQSAALYDMIPARPQNAKPFGEWNSGGITIKDGKVTHYQNGVAVVEYTLWDDTWSALLKNSKFRGGEIYNLLMHVGGPEHEGYIGLQNHGNDVWFRNIRVKVLD